MQDDLTKEQRAVVYLINQYLANHIRGQITLNIDGSTITSITEIRITKPEEIKPAA